MITEQSRKVLWAAMNAYPGKRGPQGPQGDPGPAGAHGAQGPVGPEGPSGQATGTGPFVRQNKPEIVNPLIHGDMSIDDGTLTVARDPSQSMEVATKQYVDSRPVIFGGGGGAGGDGGDGTAGPPGPEGPTGPQGNPGPQGDPGAAGSQGPQGAPGMDGASGPQGPQGDTGATGATGPQGPVGVATATPPLSLTGTTLSIDLSAYAPLASPTFTGNPTAPTPTAGDNDTSIATTAFVNTKAGNYLPLAGGTLTGALAINYGSNASQFHVTVAAGGGGLYLTSIGGSSAVVSGGSEYTGGNWIARHTNATSFGDNSVGEVVVTTDTGLTVGSGFTQTPRFKVALNGDVSVLNTTASTSPTTGALTVAGGLGVGDNVSLANQKQINFAPTSGNNGFIIMGADNILGYIGGPGGQKWVNNAANAVTMTLSDTGALHVLDTTASTSPSTGALTVAGGLGVGGNIYANQGYKPGGGQWVDSSDARIKTVLGDYQHGLAEVLQLVPKRYVYKGNDTSDATSATKFPYENSPHYSVATDGIEYIGLIAQEAEIVMPELVTLTAGYIDGMNKVADLRRLDSNALIFALVNSVKELNARLQVLEGG